MMINLSRECMNSAKVERVYYAHVVKVNTSGKNSKNYKNNRRNYLAICRKIEVRKKVIGRMESNGQ